MSKREALPRPPGQNYVSRETRTVDDAQYSDPYDALKRAIDVVVAASVITLCLPVWAATALLIRIDSKGPVIFRQQRIGQHMRPFIMLKFRTMEDGSDRVSSETLKANGFGPQSKQNKDPRITRVGRTLRRLSLDELPQFVNILRGDMSLVGPRPLLGWELEERPIEEALRVSVKPGLTGLWQVNGRSDLPFGEMLRLDLEYVERRSFWLDLRILFRTVPSVISGRGAY